MMVFDEMMQKTMLQFLLKEYVRRCIEFSQKDTRMFVGVFFFLAFLLQEIVRIGPNC